MPLRLDIKENTTVVEVLEQIVNIDAHDIPYNPPEDVRKYLSICALGISCTSFPYSLYTNEESKEWLLNYDVGSICDCLPGDTILMGIHSKLIRKGKVLYQSTLHSDVLRTSYNDSVEWVLGITIKTPCGDVLLSLQRPMDGLLDGDYTINLSVKDKRNPNETIGDMIAEITVEMNKLKSQQDRLLQMEKLLISLQPLLSKLENR